MRHKMMIQPKFQDILGFSSKFLPLSVINFKVSQKVYFLIEQGIVCHIVWERTPEVTSAQWPKMAV